MKVIFSDEENRLTDEIRALMLQAGDAAAEQEFGEIIPADADDPTENADIEVSVTVVNGEEIRELNRDYRGIDRVTDVLSFPQYDGRDELAEVLSGSFTEEFVSVLAGDVVLCYDRAVEQAAEYGTGITRELVYLFVHSIFHLFGYDHEDEDERREMRAREEQVLKTIGLTRG